MSLLFLSYIIYLKPHIEGFWNWVEIFNESCYLMVTHLLIMIQFVDHWMEFKRITGYILLAIIVLHFLANLLIFYADVLTRVKFIFRKLQTLFLYENRTINELKQMTPEEFSRRCLINYSSHAHNIRQKPTTWHKPKLQMSNHMSFVSQATIEFEHFPFTFDSVGNPLPLPQELRKNPVKRFYKIKLPYSRDNQIVPITNTNNSWDDDSIFTTRMLDIMKAGSIIRTSTRRQRIDHLGWKFYQKKLKEWHEDDRLSVVSERSKGEEFSDHDFDVLPGVPNKLGLQQLMKLGKRGKDLCQDQQMNIGHFYSDLKAAPITNREDSEIELPSRLDQSDNKAMLLRLDRGSWVDKDDDNRSKTQRVGRKIHTEGRTIRSKSMSSNNCIEEESSKTIDMSTMGKESTPFDLH